MYMALETPEDSVGVTMSLHLFSVTLQRLNPQNMHVIPSGTNREMHKLAYRLVGKIPRTFSLKSSAVFSLYNFGSPWIYHFYSCIEFSTTSLLFTAPPPCPSTGSWRVLGNTLEQALPKELALPRSHLGKQHVNQLAPLSREEALSHSLIIEAQRMRWDCRGPSHPAPCLQAKKASSSLN